MVDFARYYVDPRPELARAGQTQQQLTQQRFQNALALRQAQMAQGQERRAQEQWGLKKQAMAQGMRSGPSPEKQKIIRDLMERKLSTLSGLLGNVNNRDSYESFKRSARMMGRAGMLEQWMIDEIPEEYDSTWVEESKKAADTALEKGPVYEKPYAGPRGSMLQRRKDTGEVKTVIGQAPATGQGRDTKTELTLKQKLDEVDDTYDRLTRTVIDREFGGYKTGPEDDPDLYRRMDREAQKARLLDKDLVMAGKEPKHLRALVDEVDKAGSELQKESALSQVTVENVVETLRLHGTKDTAGDVLRKIARKYNTSVEDMLRDMGVSVDELIKRSKVE